MGNILLAALEAHSIYLLQLCTVQFAGALEWVELFQIELISQHSFVHFDVGPPHEAVEHGATSSFLPPPRVASALPPYQFRHILQRALTLFPANPTILGLFLDVERHSRSAQRVSTYMTQTINRCMWVGPSLSEWLFMIQFEVQRAEAEMEMHSSQEDQGSPPFILPSQYKNKTANSLAEESFLRSGRKRWSSTSKKRIRSLFERALDSNSGGCKQMRCVPPHL